MSKKIPTRPTILRLIDADPRSRAIAKALAPVAPHAHWPDRLDLELPAYVVDSTVGDTSPAMSWFVQTLKGTHIVVFVTSVPDLVAPGPIRTAIDWAAANIDDGDEFGGFGGVHAAVVCVAAADLDAGARKTLRKSLTNFGCKALVKEPIVVVHGAPLEHALAPLAAAIAAASS